MSSAGLILGNATYPSWSASGCPGRYRRSGGVSSTVVSLTITPDNPEPTAELSSEENEPTELSSAKTTSLRREGAPSGVRVVSAFARFSTRTSVRARCAVIPDALTDNVENKLTNSYPPGWRSSTFEVPSAPDSQLH